MRYALYFTPPEDHDLTRAANTWLGRNAFSGEMLPQESLGSLSAAYISDITSAPRRYGFHGTLRAPFYLAPNKSKHELATAVDQFSKAQKPFKMPALKVGRLGPFFALVPAEDTTQLNQFTGEVLKAFEPFRAPLTEADYQRRKPERLTERQRNYLKEWGYPYIFDDFRFHMTLTGPVPEEEADAMEDVLENIFAPHLNSNIFCKGPSLFVESEANGPFIANDTASKNTPKTERP
ncbi:MAG: DUF1045 domain-containing protein [Hyphomicrobiales bacterium]